MTKTRTSDSPRARLLLAALPDVPFDGWTEDVLVRAAQKEKISPATVQELFPRGINDLVKFFPLWADAAMLAQLPSGKKWDDMRVRDRIALAVETRLDILAPHKQAVRAAMGWLAPPPRHIQLPKMVWATADAIWRRAGDTATDYNHYTKRILLSGVLATTTLFWLNDDSDGHDKTKAFLSRRIDNVLKIGKAIGKFRKTAR